MKQAGHLKVTGCTPEQFLMHKQGRDKCPLHHLYVQPAMETNSEKPPGKTPQVLWYFPWKCVYTDVFELQKFLTVLEE